VEVLGLFGDDGGLGGMGVGVDGVGIFLKIE